MKKIIFFILLLTMLVSGYIIYNNFYKNTIKKIMIEETIINVDTIYIYGTHLNIEGELIPTDNIDLVLYNGSFIEQPIIINDSRFSLSSYVNDGLYLDNIEKGKYYLFLRSKYTENEKEKYKYYALKNISEYKETTYYTMSNYNKKIIISSEETYPTMIVTVKENKDKDIYDIVLDAGHGGRDPGATKYGYSETDFTLDIALKVKEKLEEQNIKVKLTRDKNSLTKSEKLPEYGTHGRAVIPGEVKAKYLFSFHLNSNSSNNVRGLEIYTAANINYSFAKTLANNITTSSGIKYSNNKINKIANGIYTRTFTNSDVAESKKEYESNQLLPYDFSTKSNYYYIIRETGGIITGAYVDSRNNNEMYNPNYNTNTGTEAYLLELGYMTNKTDLNNMKNNMDKYTDAIAKSIIDLYNGEK